jgi:hypothetical protein
MPSQLRPEFLSACIPVMETGIVPMQKQAAAKLFAKDRQISWIYLLFSPTDNTLCLSCAVAICYSVFCL